MRSDELFAINMLCEYLYKSNRCSPTEIHQEPFGKSTAPDFLIQFGDKSVAVEVTQTGEGFLLLNGDKLLGDPVTDGVDKIKYESSAIDFLENAFENDSKKNGNWVREGDSIVIMYKSPIPPKNRSKIAKRTLKTIKFMYQNDQIPTYEEIDDYLKPEFTVLTGQNEIKGVSLEIFKTDSYQSHSNYSPIIENYFCSYYSPEPPYDGSLSMQAGYILTTTIEGKQKKCIKLSMPKWLILLNTHPILHRENYQQIIDEHIDYFVKFGFEKVFMVDKGECGVLFSKEAKA